MNEAEYFPAYFPPQLQHIIKEILINGKVGISSHNLKIRTDNTKIIEGSFPYKKSFILEIPYASKVLYWDIVFNDEDDSFAPDFEFTNDFFLYDPEPNIISKNIPSLAKWNIDNKSSLLNVIREFLALYKQTQIAVLQEREVYSQLVEEYNLLKTKLNITEDNIEIYVERNGNVHFLINLNVDFSNLPPYVQPVLLGMNYNLLNPCEDTAALRISFSKFDGSRFTSDLQLSPRLEQVIGNSSSLHIPKMNKEKGLTAYVEEVNKLLSDKVENICLHYSLRQQYIQVLLSRCAEQVVEYNNKLFTSASILCEVDSFIVLVMITIGKNFPQEQPKVVLRSLYNMTNGKPMIYTLERYPYSPRWKSQEMIERLLVCLSSEAEKFLSFCTDKDKN